MERLRQVAGPLTVIASVVFGFCTAPAQDSCSLVVRALSPDGRRPMVPVSVREQSGRVEDKNQGDGDVRFCDLGILPVTVTVGSDSTCGQVTIHDVAVSLDTTHLLDVTYDPDSCPERIPPPVPSCLILFRVADGSGKWVPGALIRMSSSDTTLRADEFGRALFEARTGSAIRGSVTADGFRPAEFTWACPDSDPHEKVIVLVRR